MKLDFGKILSLAPMFMGIVEGVQRLRDSKTGPERAEIAVGLGKSVVATVNGIKPDTLNAPAVDALIREGIETTYQVMKLQARLREIDEQIKATYANPLAAADGTGTP